MKYVVLKGTVINGSRVSPGDVVEVSDQEAIGLLGINRICKAKDEPVIVDRSVGLSEETKPKRRRRKAD